MYSDMTNKQVVIYARVSSREQEREGFSIPAQLKLLKEYALRNGFQIVREYSDAETAKQTGRTNYNVMLDFLKANPNIRTVLVEKTDRLYRNFKDYVTLEDYDLEVHLVKEGTIISKNSRSHEKFIHGIKVLMAKNYIDNLSEEVSKGLREAVEEGYWPFNPPYGYKRGEKKNLHIDTAKGLFIRRAFELFATGKYSIRKLSDKLFEEGFYYKPDRAKITHSVLEGMLKNVMYTGQMKCNGIIYQGKHPALIDIDLFEKAQKAFKKTDKSKVRKNFDFLFPAIAKCEVCGYAICGERKIHGGQVYYRCSHYDRSCPNTSYISERELCNSLFRHLKRIALDEELYNLIKMSLEESLKDEQDYHKIQIESLNTQIEQTKEVLKNMYLDQVNNVLDKELWITFKNEYEVKLNKLYAELQKHNNANVDYMETGLRILDVCRTASTPYKEISGETIAQLIRETTKSVTVNNKKVKVTFAEPFETIEKLIRIAKQEIQENNFSEFRTNIIAQKDHCIEAIKKEPEGSILNSSNCLIWWA